MPAGYSFDQPTPPKIAMVFTDGELSLPLNRFVEAMRRVDQVLDEIEQIS